MLSLARHLGREDPGLAVVDVLVFRILHPDVPEHGAPMNSHVPLEAWLHCHLYPQHSPAQQIRQIQHHSSAAPEMLPRVSSEDHQGFLLIDHLHRQMHCHHSPAQHLEHEVINNLARRLSGEHPDLAVVAVLVLKSLCSNVPGHGTPLYPHVPLETRLHRQHSTLSTVLHSRSAN